MPRLEGLKHSPPLHATHLTGTASGLRGQSFERPLDKTNKMAYQKNLLTASLIFFFSLIPLAAAFQCIGLLFCTLQMATTKNTARAAMFIDVFAVNLTSANRDGPAPTVYMEKAIPPSRVPRVGGLPCLACKRFKRFTMKRMRS